MQILRVLVCAAFLAAACAGQDAVFRLPEGEAKRAAVARADPDYPAMARQMHIAGRVVVDIYIDEDGRIEKVQPVSGNLLLTGAAVSAVKKWRFNPFQRKVVTAMVFEFKL